MRRPARVLVAAAAIVVVATGCTSVVDGSASRAAGSVTPDGVDLEVIDTGNYPTTPFPAYGTAGTEEAGKFLESIRLANNTVLPSDVDPALIDYSLLSASSMGDTDSLAVMIPSYPDGTPNEMTAAAAAHGFILGFASRRYNADNNDGLTNAVLIFPDEAAAKAAATEMAAADQREWPDSPAVPHPIPEHPDAVAYARTSSDGVTVGSYTPRGKYVLFQSAFTKTVEASTDLVVKTLDRQVPLLDQFVPTDPAKYTDLPIDPSGLLAKTIPAESSSLGVRGNVTYQPDAALHFQHDPLLSRTVFDEVGMVSVASGKTTVYETSQDDGGARVAEAFAAEAVDSMGFSPASGVMGMPNVQCFSSEYTLSTGATGSQHYCLGSTGRYAFEVVGDQETDVHQLIAAEYRILTAQ